MGASRAQRARRPRKARRAALVDGPSHTQIGGDLLSQALAGQVPSALRGLTALFGMGRGVSPSLWPPKGRETGGPPPSPQNRTAGRLKAGIKYPSSPRSISTGSLSALLR